MQGLKDLQEIIDQEISKISFLKHPQDLYDPINYVMRLGGKRMRPILVLIAHQLFQKDIRLAIPPAIGIEVFHNFTLLHDDIMDKAPLRRGKETVHKKWNDNVAILSGDAMLIQAYQFICDVDTTILKQILDVFNITALTVCEGQQLDIDFETDSDVTISDYLKMIEYKTAVLLAASLQIGGITAKTSLKNQNHLYEFGKNMGIAFQLKDDLLDVFGNTKDFGKQIGGDIMKNKKTYLYLKALDVANKQQYKDLRRYFSTVDSNYQKVDAVKAIFLDLDIYNLTLILIKEYYTKAMKNLDKIDSKNKEPLLEFSEFLLDRSF